MSRKTTYVPEEYLLSWYEWLWYIPYLGWLWVKKVCIATFRYRDIGLAFRKKPDPAMRRYIVVRDQRVPWSPGGPDDKHVCMIVPARWGGLPVRTNLAALPVQKADALRPGKTDARKAYGRLSSNKPWDEPNPLHVWYKEWRRMKPLWMVNPGHHRNICNLLDQIKAFEREDRHTVAFCEEVARM